MKDRRLNSRCSGVGRFGIGGWGAVQYAASGVTCFKLGITSLEGLGDALMGKLAGCKLRRSARRPVEHKAPSESPMNRFNTATSSYVTLHRVTRRHVTYYNTRA